MNGFIRHRPWVQLCALLIVCPVAGCASLSQIRPSLRPYAEIHIEKAEYGRPAVGFWRIKKEGNKNDEADNPRNYVFYLEPGKYYAKVHCNRTYTAKDGSTVFSVGDPTSLDYNFSFTVEAHQIYSLDCSLTEKSEDYTLTAIKFILSGTD